MKISWSVTCEREGARCGHAKAREARKGREREAVVVVGHRIAELRIERLRQRLGGGADDRGGVVGRERRVDLRLRLREVRHLLLVLLEQLDALVLLAARRQRDLELRELLRLLRREGADGVAHLRLHGGERVARAGVVVDELVPPRALDDLVVDVGHVHLQEHLEVEVVLHDPPQDVHRQVRARVAHVARVVHRRPARVPLDLVALERHELLLLARQRVVHAQPRRHRRGGRGRRHRLEPRRVAVLVERHAELADVLRTFAARDHFGGHRRVCAA